MKTYEIELNEVVYIVNEQDNICINSKNGEVVSYDSIKSLIQKKLNKGATSFKGEWTTLDEKEKGEIVEQVLNDDTRFIIYSDNVSGIYNEKEYNNKISIIIDTQNINDSFILKTNLLQSDEMNEHGFSPYSMCNGLTNSLLYYAVALNETENIFNDLGFISTGNNYVNFEKGLIATYQEQIDTFIFKKIINQQPKTQKTLNTRL